MASPDQRSYGFGPFVVDPIKRRLWRDGQLVPITSKTFEVLVALLEGRDHIVSKDDLLTRVWPDTIVNENNLVVPNASFRALVTSPCGLRMARAFCSNAPWCCPTCRRCTSWV